MFQIIEQVLNVICKGLAGLSVCGETDLEEVHPSLNVSMRAFQHWEQLVNEQ